MNRQWLRKVGVIFLPAVFAVIAAALPVAAVSNDPTYGENQMEVLAHGPIHEAFAEAMAFDPEPGIIVPKAPPEAINEIPPDQKPDGDVEWIPGYWGWDDDRNDFIWISGTWRVVPPGRQWVPGYWVDTQAGYQWISGYWASEVDNTTTYLPEPPESVELGPNVNAPSANHTWIPGCWIWYQNGYAWRPGYWAPVRPDWVWVPAHYLWTPMGYVFVAGYWDFAVDSRGVFFAPVAFGVGVSFGSGFYFTPSFMINLGIFSNCLFLRPRYHHYYFGDYYAPRYYQRGIYPWFSPHARRHGYDPIYAHQRWKHRNDPHWKRNLQATYQLRRRDPSARPPRTLGEARRLQQESITAKASGRAFKPPFDPLTGSRGSLPKLKTLSKNERVQFERRGKELRNLSQERLKVESRGLKQPSRGPSGEIKATLPKSPIASKPVGRASVKGPPERPRPSRPVEASPSKGKSVQVPGKPSVKTPETRTIQKSESLQKAPARPSKATGAPTVRKTPPKPAGFSKSSQGSSKPAGTPTTRKSPPARYQTPKTDPTVQPVQRKPSKASGGTPDRPAAKQKNAPNAPSRLSKPSGAPSRQSPPEAPRRAPEVQRPQGAPPGGWNRPGGAMPNPGGHRPSPLKPRP